MDPTRQHVAFKPAIVLLDHGDGTYKVVPDSGRGSSRAIDGVRPIMEMELFPGDRVVLAWERPGEHPRILNVGGGSGCAPGLIDFGAIID